MSEVNSSGGQALGLSGVDGGILRAKITKPELGLVGEIEHVNSQPLQVLIKNNIIPIISPVSIQIDQLGNLTDQIELHYVNEINPGYFWIFPSGGKTANIGVGLQSSIIKQKKKIL